MDHSRTFPSVESLKFKHINIRDKVYSGTTKTLGKYVLGRSRAGLTGNWDAFYGEAFGRCTLTCYGPPYATISRLSETATIMPKHDGNSNIRGIRSRFHNNTNGVGSHFQNNKEISLETSVSNSDSTIENNPNNYASCELPPNSTLEIINTKQNVSTEEYSINYNLKNNTNSSDNEAINLGNSISSPDHTIVNSPTSIYFSCETSPNCSNTEENICSKANPKTIIDSINTEKNGSIPMSRLGDIYNQNTDNDVLVAYKESMKKFANCKMSRNNSRFSEVGSDTSHINHSVTTSICNRLYNSKRSDFCTNSYICGKGSIRLLTNSNRSMTRETERNGNITRRGRGRRVWKGACFTALRNDEIKPVDQNASGVKLCTTRGNDIDSNTKIEAEPHDKPILTRGHIRGRRILNCKSLLEKCEK